MTGEITDRRESARVSYQFDDSMAWCRCHHARSFAPARSMVQFGFDLLQWGDIDDVDCRQRHRRAPRCGR